MKTIHSALLGAALGVALSACAHTGDVRERTPITKPLSSFSSVQVSVVAADPSAKNSAQHVDRLQNTLLTKLRAANVFSEIKTDATPGDLTLKVTLVAADGGGGPLMGSTHNDAEANVQVTLLDSKDGQAVGEFEASGNSSSNVKTSVGGVDTSLMSDQTPKALDAAADQIVEYLKKKKN